MDRRRWRILSPDRGRVAGLARELRLPGLAATVLANRGHLTPGEARAFLAPSLSRLSDPECLSGMATAQKRVADAIVRGETIGLVGDYDADGTTGAAQVQLFLQEAGSDARVHIPRRGAEGYGVSEDAVRRLHREGATLLVTCDLGLSDHGPLGLARSLGMEAIILDHHRVPDEPPEVLAVIHPKRSRSEATCHFTGSGLAFMLIAAVRRELRERGWWERRPEPDLRAYLDLVALGTIADVAPLAGDNRTLVAAGLAALSSPDCRAGLRALKQVSGLGDGPVGEWDVAFRLAPRINAAGRMAHGMEAFRLLVATEEEDAVRLANLLEERNLARRKTEEEILAEAEHQARGIMSEADAHALVLAKEGWHEGVIGIVASRVAQAYGRPTLVIGVENGLGKGSGRSFASFNLYEGMKALEGMFLRFGGHSQAVGFTLEEALIPELAVRLNAQAGKDPAALEEPPLDIDATARLAELDRELACVFERLAPFGPGNPEPVFMVEDFHVVAARTMDGGHVRMLVEQEGTKRWAVGFRLLEEGQPVPEFTRLAVVPEINRFRGEEGLRLRVVGFH